ncbi:MAG: argininosuccinate lyase [Gammaproteobacteria bacterium]
MTKAHATWGGRFKKSLNPKVIEFNASLPLDHRLYAFDIAGSIAHAQMLGAQHLISREACNSIVTALGEIEIEIQNKLYPLNLECEDVHMWIEARLIEKIGEAGKMLHTGRSRNDQVALDLRLYTRDAIEIMSAHLQILLDVLMKLQDEYQDIVMPGYTHLQQAQPIALKTYFGAYYAMFSRDSERLKQCHARLNYSPLGAGALAGSHLPLDRAFVEKALGFQGIIENTLDAVSDRDYIIELASVGSMIMMHLSRLSEDLIIWASTEFDFVQLDDAFATGSSLMPNKKNPDILELVRGKSGRVFGHLMGILTIMKSLPMAYNKDMQEDKYALFDVVDTLIACLDIMPNFLESLSFNENKMQLAAESGYLEATKLLEKLVLQGIPFRTAHHQVGQWVQEAIDTGRPLKEISVAKGVL